MNSPVTLHDYQQAVKDFITSRPHAGLFLEMGLGKTLCTLNSFNTIMPQGHILVVAPLNIVRSTWVDEIEKWGFNVRTVSLVVDDNGRQLSKEERLRRIEQIHTDPPTMYFINREMLTQTSNPTVVLVHGDEPRPADLKGLAPQGLDAKQQAAFDISAEVAAALLDRLDDLKQVQQDDLVQTVIDDATQAGSKPPTKKSITDALRLLKKHNLIKNDRVDCLTCKGDGGPCCQFGLIDQMPIYTQNGKKYRTWPFPTVVLDESQGFKNPSSSRFKALKTVRPAISRIIELTGTPTPQSLLDLWSQIYLLDEGQALGKTFSEYKERWFIADRYVDNRPVSWVPKAGAEQEIYQRISHLVMSVKNTSLKLPDLTVNDVLIHLDPDEMKAYREFARKSVLDLVDMHGDEVAITAANAAVLVAKLTQFASGTMYTDAVKKEFQTVHTKKLEYLDYLLRNTSTPVIVGYRFIADRVMLTRELTKLGHDVHVFDGSRQMVASWNAGRYPVMLLQPASAGHGLNLQDGGHTIVWYTLPNSLEHYLQTNARLHRQGQKNPVIIHRLLTKGTYDQRLPLMLSTKKYTQDDLIEAVRVEVGSFLDNPWLTHGDDDPDHDYGFDTGQLL